MAETTKNYNLKKPATTDFVDIEVINEDMDIIDEEIKKANEEVTGEKEARENAIKDVKEGVNDSLLIQEVAIELEAIAAGKTYKPTVNLPYIEGYTPICAFFKASGSNNIYNYYSRIDLINDDQTHNRYYQLYTEWKNPSSVNVSKVTAGFNVLYRKMIS